MQFRKVKGGHICLILHDSLHTTVYRLGGSLLTPYYSVYGIKTLVGSMQYIWYNEVYSHNILCIWDYTVHFLNTIMYMVL